MTTRDFLIILLEIYQFAAFCCALYMLRVLLLMTFNIKYKGHDKVGIDNIVRLFALEPDTLTVELGTIKPVFIFMPAL